MVLTLSLQPNYDGTSFSVLSLLTLAIIGPYIFIACSFLCSWYCLFCVLFVIFAFFCPCIDFLYHVGTNYDSPNLVLSLLTLAILGPYIVIVLSFICSWHRIFCFLFVLFSTFCPCNDFLYHVGTNYDDPNLVLSLLTLAILGPYIVIVLSFLRIWHVYSGFCLFLFRNLFVSESILTNFVFHQNRIPISNTFGRTF